MVLPRSLALPVLLLGGLAAPGAAPAQDGIRAHASSFIFARHSTKSASSLYAGYGMGPAGFFVAAVVSAHSDYREHLGGVYTTFSRGKQGLTVGLATAEASDGYYLQTYLVPNLNAGRFRLSGTIEWYEPLETGAVRQVDVNPLTLALAVSTNLRLGAVFATGMAEDAEDTQRAGGMIEVGIPRGSLSLELLHRFQAAKPEIRIGSYVEF